MVTVVPLIVAGPLKILKLTGRALDAVALTVNGALPYVLPARVPKVMFWVA
jgi:hypothetical protein